MGCHLHARPRCEDQDQHERGDGDEVDAGAFPTGLGHGVSRHPQVRSYPGYRREYSESYLPKNFEAARIQGGLFRRFGRTVARWRR
jgi:hypothetical protein